MFAEYIPSGTRRISDLSSAALKTLEKKTLGKIGGSPSVKKTLGKERVCRVLKKTLGK